MYFQTKIADIRDTVNYKEVMKQFNLGPNGGIITSLNLFSTRFDQIMNLLEKREKDHKYVILDTPGQIEVFTWSASGNDLPVPGLITFFYGAHETNAAPTSLYRHHHNRHDCIRLPDDRGLRYGRRSLHFAHHVHVQHALRVLDPLQVQAAVHNRAQQDRSAGPQVRVELDDGFRAVSGCAGEREILRFQLEQINGADAGQLLLGDHSGRRIGHREQR